MVAVWRDGQAELRERYRGVGPDWQEVQQRFTVPGLQKEGGKERSGTTLPATQGCQAGLAFCEAHRGWQLVACEDTVTRLKLKPAHLVVLLYHMGYEKPAHLCKILAPHQTHLKQTVSNGHPRSLPKTPHTVAGQLCCVCPSHKFG